MPKLLMGVRCKLACKVSDDSSSVADILASVEEMLMFKNGHLERTGEDGRTKEIS
jgi:hypothetical protein